MKKITDNRQQRRVYLNRRRNRNPICQKTLFQMSKSRGRRMKEREERGEENTWWFVFCSTTDV